MQPRRSALLHFLALALAGLAPHCPGQTTLNFDATPDRVWIGRDWWANRLQDWRVQNGRLECVEAGKNLPMRTAHCLTQTLGARNGDAEISVRLGPIDPAAALGPHAAAGLLLGAGGIGIDPRLTAQVHHVPAEDGGMVILVERDGKISIRRNDQPLENTPLWAINTPLGPDQLPLLGDGMVTPVARQGDEYTLVVRIVHGQTKSRVAARVQDEGGNVLYFAIAEVDPALTDGSIALVSTGGPEGSPSGFWFDDLTTTGSLVSTRADRAFGPVWHTMYLRDQSTIRLTAQLPPLAPLGAPADAIQLPDAELWVEDDGWRKITTAPVVPDSWTATFQLEHWDTGRDIPYEVRFAEPTTTDAPLDGARRGLFRAAPDATQRDYVIGSLSCNKTYTGGLKWNRFGLWFPHDDLVAHLAAQNPDLLFFAGDQIYEGDLTPADRRNEDLACLDYLYKWTKWCWAFGPLTADRPTVAIPDDHDVFHGNLWGAGGRRAEAHDGLTAQDSGGYVMSPRFVNMVHRTQTSNLPPPKIDPVVGDGYTTYTTSFTDAGVSFAVFSDREFKESPSVAVPAGKFRNGWPQAEGFDPATQADDPAIPLLGAQQEQFLHEWAADWSHGAWMKFALSQSPLAAAHTLPASAKDDEIVGRLPSLAPGEYPSDDVPVADADTNGWPHTGRQRAVEALREGFAFHLAGDQHLATLIRYGLDDWRDASICLTSPAIANTWPRRWYPTQEGANRAEGRAPQHRRLHRRLRQQDHHARRRRPHHLRRRARPPLRQGPRLRDRPTPRRRPLLHRRGLAPLGRSHRRWRRLLRRMARDAPSIRQLRPILEPLPPPHHLQPPGRLHPRSPPRGSRNPALHHPALRRVHPQSPRRGPMADDRHRRLHRPRPPRANRRGPRSRRR
ncbi:MAG: hypothetical protein IPJ41_14885 [Phycisphaerales bacterium]|nr:hypothetical protein [Phycisphaerales bacterium]